ncbi:MAG: ATP-binding cassette domain-containing protein [Betaproteobacteria bacterium]|nr:ATP-binding cassette domain-containing protein [Betaproteobacteria bacterium]
MSRMLMGLDKPTAGEILLLGRPLAQFSEHRARAHIQMVWDPYSSLSPARTGGTVWITRWWWHFRCTRQKAPRRCKLWNSSAFCPGMRQNLPSQLSGGQRQRSSLPGR